jgi:hypothetical protein
MPFILKDAIKKEFPANFILYHCDASYDWLPINQLKRELKTKLGAARLSVRVVAMYSKRRHRRRSSCFR